MPLQQLTSAEGQIDMKDAFQSVPALKSLNKQIFLVGKDLIEVVVIELCQVWEIKKKAL